MDLQNQTLAQTQPSPPPVHCEAYPGFAITSVNAAWHGDTRFCEWFCEQGGLAAQMDLLAYSDAELRILYSCGDDTYRHQRQAHFAIFMMRQISRRIEPRIVCAPCGKPVAKVFYRNQRWACQQCQKLVQRRSLLDAEQKLMVRREKLISQVHARSGPIRSLKAHDRARYQLVRVIEQLADAPLTLERPLRHVLKPRWFADQDERTECEPHDVTPAYLDYGGSCGPDREKLR